jgi:signal transduction histidine kinase
MFPDLSRIDQCSELITRAANDLTNICGYLHPLLIDEQGLAVAVEDYARGFEKRSGLEIRVDIPQDVQRLDIDREITLFRVIQESLESIHQHSGSPTAHIRMSASDSDIVLEVRDYGRALLSEELNNAVGIRSMRERVRNVGGSLLLESSSNGTVVRAILPL